MSLIWTSWITDDLTKTKLTVTTQHISFYLENELKIRLFLFDWKVFKKLSHPGLIYLRNPILSKEFQISINHNNDGDDNSIFTVLQYAQNNSFSEPEFAKVYTWVGYYHAENINTIYSCEIILQGLELTIYNDPESRMENPVMYIVIPIGCIEYIEIDQYVPPMNYRIKLHFQGDVHSLALSTEEECNELLEFIERNRKKIWGEDCSLSHKPEEEFVKNGYDLVRLAPNGEWQSCFVLITNYAVRIYKNARKYNDLEKNLDKGLLYMSTLTGASMQRLKMLSKSNVFALNDSQNLLTVLSTQSTVNAEECKLIEKDFCDTLRASILENTSKLLTSGTPIHYTCYDTNKGLLRIFLSKRYLKLEQLSSKETTTIPLNEIGTLSIDLETCHLELETTSSKKYTISSKFVITFYEALEEALRLYLEESPEAYNYILNIKGGEKYSIPQQINLHSIDHNDSVEGFTIDDLRIIYNSIKDPVNGIKLQKRTLLFLTFEETFGGAELLEWLKINYKLTEKQGTKIGNMLLENHFITHTSTDLIPFTKICWYSIKSK